MNGYGLLGLSYCGDEFPASGWPYSGWTDLQSGLIITKPHDPSPSGNWNISKGGRAGEAPPAPTDLHSLMYGGGASNITTKVVMETQSWFCTTATSSNCTQGTSVLRHNQTFPTYEGHNGVQYTAWDQNTMDARAIDMWDEAGTWQRGIGMVVRWIVRRHSMATLTII